MVPQHRERIFLIGIRKDLQISFAFPDIPDQKPKFRDILDINPDPKYTLSPRLWDFLQNYRAKHEALGHGFGYSLADPNGITNTLSARYYKDGSEILIAQKGKPPRKLTPAEAARLQGFPEKWQKPVVSDSQAYKQFGNAVAVPLVTILARALVSALSKSHA